MNGPIQVLDSIFESAFFRPLRTSTFSPTSNLFAEFSGADSTTRDAQNYLAIATLNSLAKLVLSAINSSSGGSEENLGLILKNILEGNFPSVPRGRRYPPSILPRHTSQ